jgi:hypothetical protein
VPCTCEGYFWFTHYTPHSEWVSRSQSGSDCPLCCSLQVLVLVASDVTDHVQAELDVRKVLDKELSILEEIYPRHVLEAMTSDSQPPSFQHSPPQHNNSSQHNSSQLTSSQFTSGSVRHSAFGHLLRTSSSMPFIAETDTEREKLIKGHSALPASSKCAPEVPMHVSHHINHDTAYFPQQMSLPPINTTSNNLPDMDSNTGKGVGWLCACYYWCSVFGPHISTASPLTVT